MKYEDYRVEDQVFTNKADWTEEEMKEFLDTCPESIGNEITLKALQQLLEDIENGTVKMDCFGTSINRNSGKAYAKKHDGIYYGNASRWRDENELYVLVDGYKETISNDWRIRTIINKLNDVSDRFTILSSKYKEQEEKYRVEQETKNYTETNKSRIITSKRAYEWLDDCNIEMPIRVFEDDWKLNRDDIPDFRNETRRFRGYDYRDHNKYGELCFFNQPITEDEANHIIEVMQEASRKIGLILDRVEVELNEIKEKYRERR